MIFAPNQLGRVMSETLESMQKRAREFARSGKFASWRAVVFELQFEPSLQEAFRRKYLYWPNDAPEDAFLWLHSPATKAEIDELCREARNASEAA
jgi:predicted RNA polymerase sigma factor